jgi:AbrB family looped-hinge helix DNA binding protein
MPTATITSKGQVTIPKAIRERLKVEAGDLIDFVTDEAGRVVLQPGASELTDLRGMLRKEGRLPVSLAEMDAAIARHVTSKLRRARKRRR